MCIVEALNGIFPGSGARLVGYDMAVSGPVARCVVSICCTVVNVSLTEEMFKSYVLLVLPSLPWQQNPSLAKITII